MIFVSREEIEREIELQKLERRKIEDTLTKTYTPIKTIKKANKKRAYKKRVYNPRGPYEPKKRKISLNIPINKERKVDKRINSDVQNALIRLLRLNGPMTRKELMDTTNIPWTTLFDNLEKLLKKNVIIKHSRSNKKRGRPMVVWGVVV